MTGYDEFFLWRVVVGTLASVAFVIYQLRRPTGPEHPRLVSGMAASLAVVPLGWAAITFGVGYGGATYGLAMFAALPFLIGTLTVMIYSIHRPLESVGASMRLGLMSILALGFALLVTATEGLICLAMAAPLAFPLAAFCGALGYQLSLSLRRRAATSTMMLLLFLPAGFVSVEKRFQGEPELFPVSTSIDVAVPPGRAWAAILAPSKLERPAGLAFRVGIAYPRGSWIDGSGPGAIRHCDFSTGHLIEPVLEWRENELLRFTVVQNPEPMVEWNPFAEIHPPHLKNFLVSRQGQFKLTPIPGGTRIEATTWYQHGLYPAEYWRWWSDSIIHQIHHVVLDHVRQTTQL
ncbi:MAG: hypothetical protein ABIR70_05360 [Bryobacteraceae bacterium]